MSTPEKVCNAAWHGNWQNDEGTIPDANPMHGKTFADAKAQAYAADLRSKSEKAVADAKGLGIVVRRAFAESHKALVARVVVVNRLGAAAKYLGMTPKEVRTVRQSGRSLAQIAASKGKSVDGLVAAIVAPAKARAAKAVSNGKLTQQRADELIARLTERVQALVKRVPATS